MIWCYGIVNSRGKTLYSIFVLFQVEKKLTKKKKKTVDNDVAFTKLVDKYKTTILSHKDKKKWYDN